MSTHYGHLGEKVKLLSGSEFMLEKRRLEDKKDDYASFRAEFYADRVVLGKYCLLLGELSTEFLELPDEQLARLREVTILLLDATQKIYKPLNKIENEEDLRNGLDNFLPVFKLFLDELDKLPLFRELEINQKQVIKAFVETYNDNNIKKRDWNQEFLGNFLSDILAYYDEIHIFRLYADTLLDDYVKYAKKRTPTEYAKAIHKFSNDKEIQSKLQSRLHPEKYDNVFKIEQPVNIDYITRPNPSNKKQYIVTERTVYRSLGGFLKAELYRALVAGNAPRICDNCGRYFLTIGQERTLYCNRVAPNDPKGRLCRKVGAHIKEQKLHDVAYEKAYSRAYDRLKYRKRAGLIDVDTWNKSVAEIQDIREMTRDGLISDAEAVDKFNAI